MIVDEQHRFGVMQRLKLMKKSGESAEDGGVRESHVGTDGVGTAALGRPAERSSAVAGEPDLLVMTATPIPRTLALTLYGDLDLSVLDELPPGRTPIVTKCVSDEESPKVWEFVRKQVAAGHQAYVVYPVIAENEESELKAAIKMYRELSGKIFSTSKLACCMDALDAEPKDQVMRMFQRGELQILVATTVIEVGVDVPNATVMVIEHAERFGLAQLHQLRGRIGQRSRKIVLCPHDGRKNLGRRTKAARRHDAARQTTGSKSPNSIWNFGARENSLAPGRPGCPAFAWPTSFETRSYSKRKQSAKPPPCWQELEPGSLRGRDPSRALVYMRARWQHTYGLVEVG